MVDIVQSPEVILMGIVFFSAIAAIDCWKKIYKSTNNPFYKCGMWGSFSLVLSLLLPLIFILIKVIGASITLSRVSSNFMFGLCCILAIIGVFANISCLVVLTQFEFKADKQG